ncbi:ABC transporter permease [Anaerobacillus isosaccharinicus]|uniref:ABC transporter permease n=1 Tax=Anaerobacillus isosaccharinicus TaxID=1532552 RepID=A0A1S2M3K0_9BACI|nr:ABC transporter permease [Anaerobacillus isosaccharinicus]MBA5585082.1 ABC transporter permease [Anaerobacillus isosaccharinicus]QOY36573.1 ABC transporter permease [Anaerobacillus isosaccharinicus]
MDIITIAKKEIKLGFRNPWSYTFLVTFSLFSLALLVINADSQIGIGKYTSMTGTMMNLLLYFLPLMTLLLGSFSVTSEKEDGNWQLLLSYPLSSSNWLLGKYIGIYIVIIAIVAFGFGVAGLIGILFGSGLPSSVGLFLLVFSLLLTFVFLALALFIGTLSKNRWQALTVSVSIWIFFVLAWPIIMISTLGSLNYKTLKSTIEVVTLLNPAEFTRIFMITKLGGGSIFGPEYIHWVGWASSPFGTIYFVILCIVWVYFFMLTATYLTERGRKRG